MKAFFLEKRWLEQVELALTAFIIIIFCLAAVQAGSFAYEHIGEITGYAYIASSIGCMSISGLGLILLLLIKLLRIERSAREKKKIMAELMPRMAAMEAASDGIMITNAQGIITYTNTAMASLHGYKSAGELTGYPWTLLYAEKQQQEFEKEIFGQLSERWFWQGPSQGLRHDGTTYHQDVSLTALGDGGKVWVVRDYTEVMNYIALADNRLAAIEAAGDGIGIVDKKGNLTYINKALMSLHGIAENDLSHFIGHPWENLYSSKGREQIKLEVLPLLHREGFWKGESPIVRRDGSMVFAEMSLTLLDDGGFIGTARDISSRKEAEKEREELREQFYQAQKMEAIGRLAGGIAHDFNNILAAMMGFAEFLDEDLPEDSKEQGFVRQILTGCYQAQDLVEQILAFSRRKESVHETIDLVSTISDTVAMLKSTMPSGMNLVTRIETPEALISANGTQIGQTLMNLCVNAMDAMEENRGRLTIRISRIGPDEVKETGMQISDSISYNKEPTPRLFDGDTGQTVLEIGKLAESQDYICLEISDSGCGMSREVMEHIFEPFYTTKPVDHGTGLGLSTVHGIVIAHGGAIKVSSRIGWGSEFALYFPSTPEGQIALAPEDVALMQHGAARILVVEDEEQVRNMLILLLARAGHTADSCVDGEEALRHLREKGYDYDLVLTDYTMPHMTGAELAEAIEKESPAMPVIMLSGYSVRRLKMMALDHPNIRAILRKPVRRHILLQEIDRELGEKRSNA